MSKDRLECVILRLIGGPLRAELIRQNNPRLASDEIDLIVDNEVENVIEDLVELVISKR